MGLFINSEQHHNMYRTKENIHGPNQATFQRDHLSELLKEQQKTNESLRKSMIKLGILQEQSGQNHSKQWKEMGKRLASLEKANYQQDQRAIQMLEHLKILTDENKNMQMLIEKEHISSQEIGEQIKQHYLNHQELSKQLHAHDENQQEVIKRLDHQEALTEKMLRQMSNLRSILYERTNFLAETIEDSYQFTSSYVYQLLTGTEQPLTFYMQRKQEKESRER